jgi:tetratricopeptide (TPR) repeat protein
MHKPVLATCAMLLLAFLPKSAHFQSAVSSAQAAATVLTTEQQQELDAANKLFQAKQYAEAARSYKQLLGEVPTSNPQHILIAKLTSESALNLGETAFVLDTLGPIEKSDPNDWQAASLLARLYAQTGQKSLRDAELARLVDLHRQAASPQFAKLQQIPLETIPFPKGTIRVFFSLEPWGRFNIYLMARVYDQSGKQVYRISLESADFDQPNFAKENPDLAAKDIRLFSIDGYGPDLQMANGQTTQNHSTFGFYNGKPDYDTFRARACLRLPKAMQRL